MSVCSTDATLVVYVIVRVIVMVTVMMIVMLIIKVIVMVMIVRKVSNFLAMSSVYAATLAAQSRNPVEGYK